MDKNKIMTKIIATILVVLMLVSVFGTLLFYLFTI